MIDVDKMRVAFATTPMFCRHAWARETREGMKLCALTALAVYAGVTYDEIRDSNRVLPLILPVLMEHYGIGQTVAHQIVSIYDDSPIELALGNVLRYCADVNESEQMRLLLIEQPGQFEIWKGSHEQQHETVAA